MALHRTEAYTNVGVASRSFVGETMYAVIKKLYWILSTQLGVNPQRAFYSIQGLPKYAVDYVNFRRLSNWSVALLPCLGDWREEAGNSRTEYFWQDLFVAKRVHDANPRRHVDIGSRLDGFVAHVASFREIEVFDIRYLQQQIPNVMFRQSDLMKSDGLPREYCDSLSSLHALEHFGLGRYGDPVDPVGYINGFRNMAGVLECGGTFYLSVPIGRQRVEFNAHRVFDPHTIVKLGIDNSLKIVDFAWISDKADIVVSKNITEDFDRLAKEHYSLGIFIFVKS